MFLLLDGLCVRAQQHAYAFCQSVDLYWSFLYNSNGRSVCLNKKVKMIGHKAPSQDIGVRGDIFLNFLEKEIIVSVFKEDRSFIIAPVVNMIKTTFGELHMAKNTGSLLNVRNLGVKTPERCQTPSQKAR